MMASSYTQWWLSRYRQKNNTKKAKTDECCNFVIFLSIKNSKCLSVIKAIRSIRKQKFAHWRLCIVDESENKVIEKLTQFYCKVSQKISLVSLNEVIRNNEKISDDQACYYFLMHEEMTLSFDALKEFSQCVENSNAQLIYCDDDVENIEGEYVSPDFKPDYSPDLLHCANYIKKSFIISKELVASLVNDEEIDILNNPYLTLLRGVALANKVVHLPKLLIHYQIDDFILKPPIYHENEHEAHRQAIEESIKQDGFKAQVVNANQANSFRVKRAIIANPKISIIIPFKDQPLLLQQCIHSILDKTDYPFFEIIGVSNQSTDPAVVAMMSDLPQQDSRIRFYEHNIDFNFSALINFGVSHSSGDQLAFINNDVELINEECLLSLLEHSQRDEIGVVGAKLYYPDNTIQHAGIAIGLGGSAGHVHQNRPRYARGYFNRLNTIQNVSAVTGALMMTKRSVFEQLNGFDESNFAIAFNDVDYCLRAMDKGYCNIMTPYAQAYHHESVSRGHDADSAKLQRLNKEKSNLRAIHHYWFNRGDPYYNANLDLQAHDYSIGEYNPMLKAHQYQSLNSLGKTA